MQSYIIFVGTAATLQFIILILYAIFAVYDSSIDPLNASNSTIRHGDPNLESKYPYFQDVQGMIFLGFGFLMSFLKKYGYSSIGLNFFLSAFCIEWSLIINGFFHMKNGQFYFNAENLLGAEFATATILISFGVVLGKTTPIQLLLMGLIEVPMFVINEYIGRNYLKVLDTGDSIFVHTFGAYFGLSMTRVLYRKGMNENKNESACYHSDMFSLIGTLILWMFWPSFNAGGVVGDRRHRAVVNTFCALLASTMMTFILSTAVEKGKINMVHVANSTLSGGVAIGAAADLIVRPWGACLVGMLAGTLSTLGYKYVTPFLNSRKFHDTCGVNNLHGMPGLFAGIVVAIASAFATTDNYGSSLTDIFEARTTRSAGIQAAFQIAALIMTFAFAVVTGSLTGLILTCKPFRVQVCEGVSNDDKYFNDQLFWEVPESLHHSYNDEINLQETSRA